MRKERKEREAVRDYSHEASSFLRSHSNASCSSTSITARATRIRDTSHGDSLAQLSPKDPRSMTVPVPGQAEQERYAQEYEAKQRAYEDALKQAEHYAASKETM